MYMPRRKRAVLNLDIFKFKDIKCTREELLAYVGYTTRMAGLSAMTLGNNGANTKETYEQHITTGNMG